jgi:hypothetical protein
LAVGSRVAILPTALDRRFSTSVRLRCAGSIAPGTLRARARRPVSSASSLIWLTVLSAVSSLLAVLSAAKSCRDCSVDESTRAVTSRL